MKIWDDDDDHYDDNEIIEWCDGYQKRKFQKAKKKRRALTHCLHPDCVMNCCMSEDEKKEIEKLFLTI